MLKIVSWNINGYRAVVNKNFLDFLHEEDPDIICLQETKVKPEQIPDELLNPSNYYGIWHSAERPGYSGVAVFTKIKPKEIKFGLNDKEEYYNEGRVIELDFGDFILFNIYFPNGQMGDYRLNYKLEFYADLLKYLKELKAQGKNLIVTGDYNTAHKEIDLANPKENENYSGFLPIERACLDDLIEVGFVDVFREFNQEKGQYTWWTYRFGARRRNIGWRIDYFFVNQEFLPKVQDMRILKEVLGSDHCPISLIIT